MNQRMAKSNTHRTSSSETPTNHELKVGKGYAIRESIYENSAPKKATNEESDQLSMNSQPRSQGKQYKALYQTKFNSPDGLKSSPHRRNWPGSE